MSASRPGETVPSYRSQRDAVLREAIAVHLEPEAPRAPGVVGRNRVALWVALHRALRERRPSVLVSNNLELTSSLTPTILIVHDGGGVQRAPVTGPPGQGGPAMTWEPAPAPRCRCRASPGGRRAG